MLFCMSYPVLGISLVAQMVKPLPAMQETWVQSLVWEDPVEKEMATHSSILAWEVPWTEDPVHGVTKETDMTWRLNNANIQFWNVSHRYFIK